MGARLPTDESVCRHVLAVNGVGCPMLYKSISFYLTTGSGRVADSLTDDEDNV